MASALKELGPFHPLSLPSLRGVAFDAQDPGNTGGTYTVNLPLVEPTTAAKGKLSPSYAVTLEKSDMTAAKIPIGASTFAFAYPLEGWESNKSRLDLMNAHDALVAIGGFVYWDARGNVVGVNSLCKGNGLHFIGPVRLGLISGGTALRGILLPNDACRRAQRVTIDALVTKGVRAFCWMGPGEVFPSVDNARWPHGAFVYFFDELANDCLFAVGQAPQFTTRAEHAVRSYSRPPVKHSTDRQHSDRGPMPKPFGVAFSAEGPFMMSSPSVDDAHPTGGGTPTPPPPPPTPPSVSNLHESVESKRPAEPPPKPAVQSQTQPPASSSSTPSPDRFSLPSVVKVTAAPATRPLFVSYAESGHGQARGEAPFVSWSEFSWASATRPLFVSYAEPGHGQARGEAPFVSWAASM